MRTARIPSSHLFVFLVASATVSSGAAQAPVPAESSSNQGRSVVDSIDRVSPSRMESMVYQRIAQQSGLKLTNLSGVTCDTLRCRIVFSGPDVTSQYVDSYSGLMAALTAPPWEDYMPTQSSLGRQEISPGVREYVIEFTYIALQDVSDDARIRARQHAACAGAWARVTQLRGSDDYIRTAHEQAAKHLDVAALEIGRDEATRLAKELQFGPLARDCHAMPY
jgi:hypothetical protein